MTIFGTDGSNNDTVYLRIECSELIASQRCEAIFMLGRLICKATGRDSGAWPAEDITLESGKFSSGGSRINWHTIIPAGTVFTGKFVRSAYESMELPDGVKAIEIAANTDERRVELEERRAKILAELAEIDAQLAGL